MLSVAGAAITRGGAQAQSVVRGHRVHALYHALRTTQLCVSDSDLTPLVSLLKEGVFVGFDPGQRGAKVGLDLTWLQLGVRSDG